MRLERFIRSLDPLYVLQPDPPRNEVPVLDIVRDAPMAFVVSTAMAVAELLEDSISQGVLDEDELDAAIGREEPII